MALNVVYVSSLLQFLPLWVEEGISIEDTGIENFEDMFMVFGLSLDIFPLEEKLERFEWGLKDTENLLEDMVDNNEIKST